MTATTFCIALTAAQKAPSNGIDRTFWMSPPVTMSAVPTVSSTNPQKIPACISPARGSLNILVWMNAYWIRPTTRAGIRSNGCDGRAIAKMRRWRAIARAKNAAAPQKTGKTSG